MTNFTSDYQDIILKEIVKELDRNLKSLEKAKKKKMELAETSAGVRTQAHWRSASNIEYHYNKVEMLFRKMYELDKQVYWHSKLHQDRYNFIKKYQHILNEYEDKTDIFNIDTDDFAEPRS